MTASKSKIFKFHGKFKEARISNAELQLFTIALKYGTLNFRQKLIATFRLRKWSLNHIQVSYYDILEYLCRSNSDFYFKNVTSHRLQFCGEQIIREEIAYIRSQGKINWKRAQCDKLLQNLFTVPDLKYIENC